MSEQEDKEFAAFLRRHGDVSRAYRQLRSAAPPAHLKEQIANHARAVLPSQPSALKDMSRAPTVKPSWFAPFALAASVLLSAALLMAIAIDPHARSSTDATVRLIRASANRDDRPQLTRPARAVRNPAHEPAPLVQPLIEPRRLYSSDPPGSRPDIAPAPLPPMPIEVIRRDPREWRERIEQLRREGHVEQAQAEWREFLRVYPDQH